MHPPRSRLLAGLLALVPVACAPSPTPTPPPPAAPTAPVRPASPPGAAPLPTGPTAEDHIAEWERTAAPKGKKVLFERRRVGPFLASRCTDPRESSASYGRMDAACPLGSGGAVATNAGLVRVDWERIVSTEKDVDGDGRPDLLVTVSDRSLETPRWTLGLVADHDKGPVQIPVTGVEPHTWETFEWQSDPVPTLLVRPAGSTFQRQALTWNGKALSVTDTVLLQWSIDQAPHTFGTIHHLTATAAGARIDASFEQVGQRSDEGGALLDLRGDGARYYVATLALYPFPISLDQIILELRKDGWARVQAPVLDVATRADRDANGVPEFECLLDQVHLSECQSAAPDCDVTAVRPQALATWEGHQLGARVPALAAPYATWLTEALAEVGKNRPLSDEDCPSHRVATAAKLYLARRWTGVPAAKAESEVTTWMKGVPFTDCAGPGAKPRSWPAIWKSLERSLEEALPPKP